MKCPDCNKEIGRFKVSADDPDERQLPIIHCPRSGRKMIAPGSMAAKPTPTRKDAKRKKSQQKERVYE